MSVFYPDCRIDVSFILDNEKLKMKVLECKKELLFDLSPRLTEESILQAVLSELNDDDMKETYELEDIKDPEITIVYGAVFLSFETFTRDYVLDEF